MKQEKITACLSAVGKTLSLLSDKKERSQEDLQCIEYLSDVSKLLSDLHHDESIIRRSFVLTNVNIGLKDTLQATNIGSFLFGEKLDEASKTAKALENSAKGLRVKIRN